MQRLDTHTVGCFLAFFFFFLRVFKLSYPDKRTILGNGKIEVRLGHCCNQIHVQEVVVIKGTQVDPWKVKRLY